jgi:hypothetical protein
MADLRKCVVTASSPSASLPLILSAGADSGKHLVYPEHFRMSEGRRPAWCTTTVATHVASYDRVCKGGPLTC